MLDRALNADVLVRALPSELRNDDVVSSTSSVQVEVVQGLTFHSNALRHDVADEVVVRLIAGPDATMVEISDLMVPGSIRMLRGSGPVDLG